jgi:hypothetical protein
LKKYALVRAHTKQPSCNSELCLSCTRCLHPTLKTFCFQCKAPRPPDWTSGNESLDSFIKASWENAQTKVDSYLEWIKYERLSNIETASSLKFECQQTADWENTKKVMLKLIDSGKNGQSFDFTKVKYLNYK